jgi:hypothetical protein
LSHKLGREAPRICERSPDLEDAAEAGRKA